MKIPPHLQCFDAPVSISYADQDRLGPHLSNWNRLNDIFLLGIGEKDLRKLTILELVGKRRKPVLNRLVVGVLRAERARIEQAIKESA